MRKPYFLITVLALLAAVQTSCAIELTLEENRGEAGSVGYVDIEKVFREYPETQRAKESFKTELERKEKVILDRKKEIFAMRGEIARLKLEREFTLKLSTMPYAPPPDPEQAVLNAPVVSTVAAVGVEVQFSTTAMSPVVALDYRIAAAQRRLLELEVAFKSFQAASEKEMVAFESRKTEIVLGKIYYALRELSVQESVSVVVDKKSILYGQKAVDLTDKLLRKLRGY